MADEKQGTVPRTEPDDGPADATVGELTRKQVADLLGVSVFKVRTLERKGELHPVVRDGTNFFTLVEVKALVQTGGHGRQYRGRAVDPRTDGEISAEVFKLLGAGKSLAEIVMTAAVAPERVRALYGEFVVSLEEGERRKHQRQRRLEEELEAAREDALAEEHERRMRDLDRQILAQTNQAERLASANDNARRRRSRLDPSTPAKQPSPPEPPADKTSGLDDLFSALAKRLG